MIPRPLLENENLSIGAKVLYGVLIGFAGEYGSAFPKKERIRQAMGMPSLRTLLRWQTELVKAGLIRVKLKGRWLPNNYYFLRSDILGNGLPKVFTPKVLAPRPTHPTQPDVSIFPPMPGRGAAPFEPDWEEINKHPVMVAYHREMDEWAAGGYDPEKEPPYPFDALRNAGVRIF